MDKVTIALMLALLPQPSRVVQQEGAFPLSAETKIVVDQDSPDAANVGKMLAERINRSTGLAMTVTTSDVTGTIPNAILLTTKNAKAAMGDEGYTLTASPDGVVIRASAGPGLFYGTQTLLQLLPPQVFSPKKVQEAAAWSVPAVKIEDQPRFHWRGLMLDVSRHFFNKEEVKNFIDLMAQHKMNTFHWHLADDPGWRVEIKRYPKLTEVGAWRKEILYGLDPKDGTEWGPDGRYGGFYTQDDIREIIAYAKDRYITIVPEIDMPGHSGSALAAYPEYTCTGKHDGPNQNMAVYCAGNDAGFEFIKGMLTELLDLFPSKYVHIGGDEVDKAHWKKCEKCQARMKQQGLKNENELQSYFIRRLEKFLNAHNRTLIGWDEILEGGLAPNATVMSWRGIDGGIAAAKAGHDVVMTPTSHCYFDYLQAKSGEPVGIGGFLPLNLVYSFEPIPAAIAGDKANHVLGAGGNLWTEFVPNYRHAQYMAYPRACAMAELTWSDPKQKNWTDFRKRLDSQLLRLKVQGVNYRQPRAEDDAPAKQRRMSDAAAKPDPYAPWRITDYRRYACSWFAMTFSKQIETLAVAVYFVSVFDSKDAPLALGAMGLVQALPVMLLAIAGGQMTDPFDRRRVIVAMLTLGNLSVAGLLVVALLSGSVPLIFLFLGVGAVAQALGSPSRAALLPQLVPAEIFSNAVAWNSSVFYIASVTGPVVGGAIMAMSKSPDKPLLENPAPALAVVLACRLIALAAMSLVRHRQADRSTESISLESLAAGVRFVWHTKLILATITLDMFAVLLGGATYLLPIYAKDILHVGTTGLGFLRAADAVGAICMAMLLAHMPPMRRAGVTLLWAVAGFGLATIVFGMSEWFWLSMAMMFLIGALDNISVVVRHTLVQMLTPDEMRGRVSAVNGVFIVASNDLGGLESGLTAWLFTPVISVVGGGVGTILVVLGAAWLWRNPPPSRDYS